MRSFVITTFALAVALAPAAAFAQTTSSSRLPGSSRPRGSRLRGSSRRPARASRRCRRFRSTTPAGILLVQIKPDKTAVFEEMVGKLKAGFAKTPDETLKQQARGLKVYKSSEPFGPNTLYVVLLEPTVPKAEYDLSRCCTRR